MSNKLLLLSVERAPFTVLLTYYEAIRSHGSHQVDRKCNEIVLSHYLRKNDLYYFGCVTSSLLHGVVN